MFRAEKEKDGLDTIVTEKQEATKKVSVKDTRKKQVVEPTNRPAAKSAPKTSTTTKKKSGWSTRGKFKSKDYDYTNEYKQ